MIYLKQYAFKRKNKTKKIPTFYSKLIITALIFGIVTAFCNINNELKEPVKKILYQSYDFSPIKEKSVIYIDKCKEIFRDFKNSVLQGE